MQLSAEGGERSRKRRILAVDDDPEVRKVTKAALESAGFEVWGAESGEEALELLDDRGLPHLAVIDIMLPGLDGLGLSRRIGEPFSPSELTARVKRVLRRIGDFSYTLEPVVEIDGHLAIDFVRQKAVTDGRPVALTPTETKLLYILMNQAGKTVPTEHILARLWPGEEADENTLRVHVHRLRQKVERTPSRPHYVVTERGVGYSFLAP
jgi:DNA-binding response OmpR family regulator